MDNLNTLRTHLSPEWRDWIVTNLARGCDSQSLIADMVRERFDPAFASAAVLDLSRRKAGASGAAGAPLVSGVTDATAAQGSAFAYETPRLPAGNVILAVDRAVRVVMRIERPMIAVVDGLLSDEECEELRRRSADRLRRSTTVDPVRGSFEEIPDRNSDGTYFPVNADPFIALLDRRIAALMNWPLENGEGLQILRYRTGGQYTPHFDYFPPADPGSRGALATGGQRVSSLVMYLNDVEEGGGTVFPKIGLTVTPRRGAAVYFEYCNSHGQVDPLTLHGGLPVLKGEKWIATKWMRQRSYGVG